MTPLAANRRLSRAITASIAVHLAIAATISHEIGRDSAAPPMRVTLGPATLVPARSETPPVPNTPDATAPVPSRQARPDEAAPAIADAPAAVAATPYPSPAAVADPGPPSLPATPPVAAPPPRPAMTQNVIDLHGAMRGYQSQIEQQIRAAARDAPRLARQRGWQGTALVRFLIVDGRLERPQIISSSGYDILDEQALRIVIDTALPAWPAALRGHTLALEVPISFTLKDKDAP